MKQLFLWIIQKKYPGSVYHLSRDVGIQHIQVTSFKDRILGPQSTQFQKQMGKEKLLDAEILNRMILYISAIMEVKSNGSHIFPKNFDAGR